MIRRSLVITVLLIVLGLVGTVFFISLAMAMAGAGEGAAVWPVVAGLVCFSLFFTGMARLGRLFRRDPRDRWDGYHRH